MLRSRLYRAKPMIIVGRLTASDRLPASLMFTPNNSTSVGISSSPPATPRSKATTPIPSPAMTPVTINVTPSNNGVVAVVGSCVASKNDRDDRQERRNHPTQGRGTEARRIACAQPGPDQAARQEVHDNGPRRKHVLQRDRARSKRQRTRHDNETGRFVQDDRL